MALFRSRSAAAAGSSDSAVAIMAGTVAGMPSEALSMRSLDERTSGLRQWWAVAAVALVVTSCTERQAPISRVRSAPRDDRGFEWSIESSAQGKFGALDIGVGYVGVGSYLDEHGVTRSGLHAALTITVDGKPALFRQSDVYEGETLMVGSYRILIERLLPDTTPRSTVVLRVWL